MKKIRILFQVVGVITALVLAYFLLTPNPEPETIFANYPERSYASSKVGEISTAYVGRFRNSPEKDTYVSIAAPFLANSDIVLDSIVLYLQTVPKSPRNKANWHINLYLNKGMGTSTLEDNIPGVLLERIAENPEITSYKDINPDERYTNERGWFPNRIFGSKHYPTLRKGRIYWIVIEPEIGGNVAQIDWFYTDNPLEFYAKRIGYNQLGQWTSIRDKRGPSLIVRGIRISD